MASTPKMPAARSPSAKKLPSGARRRTRSRARDRDADGDSDDEDRPDETHRLVRLLVVLTGEGRQHRSHASEASPPGATRQRMSRAPTPAHAVWQIACSNSTGSARRSPDRPRQSSSERAGSRLCSQRKRSGSAASRRRSRLTLRAPRPLRRCSFLDRGPDVGSSSKAIKRAVASRPRRMKSERTRSSTASSAMFSRSEQSLHRPEGESRGSNT